MPRDRRSQDDLLRLQREWYTRLKQEGFKDIESLQANGTMGNLLLERWESKPRPADVVALRAQYYRLCAAFLHEHAFAAERSRTIWFLYCEGVTYRAISARLQVTRWCVEQTLRTIINGPFKSYVDHNLESEQNGRT